MRDRTEFQREVVSQREQKLGRKLTEIERERAEEEGDIRFEDYRFEKEDGRGGNEGSVR